MIKDYYNRSIEVLHEETATKNEKLEDELNYTPKVERLMVTPLKSPKNPITLQ